MMAKVIKLLGTAFFLLTTSCLTFGEDSKICAVDAGDRELITVVNEKYLEFASLYTGGMHFKTLGSADGSLIIYLALNNRFELINKINKEKLIDNYGQQDNIQLYQTGAYLRRFGAANWGDEKPYDIPPSQVLKSAITVSFNATPAYKHINDLGLPYAFHYRQAGFDLDFFTGLMEPVDWWLNRDLPKNLNDVRAAVWQESKSNDFIDWLQFVATSSALPHLQNWSFADIEGRKEGYKNLKKHAYKKWTQSKSYAWLAALSEVVDIDDDESRIVLNEFGKISEKIRGCNATQGERAAYGMILTNAVRISYGKSSDIKSWLYQTKDDQYNVIKLQAGNRLSQYMLGVGSLENYRSFWASMGRDVISRYPQVSAIFATKTDDFILPGDAEPHKFDDIELRFLSVLNTEDLVRIAEQSNLSDESKKVLIRSAFLRSWVNNDTGDETLLNKLASFESTLAPAITEIINEKNIPVRKAMLLKFVMENPGITYLMGAELFADYGDRQLNEFSQLNPEDGSWWCETNTDKIIDKYLSSTVRSFGLIGNNPQTSGGIGGVDFYNPGQKRAYLRRESIMIDTDLNQNIINKLKGDEIFNYVKSKEWVEFSKLPAAPVFFS